MVDLILCGCLLAGCGFVVLLFVLLFVIVFVLTLLCCFVCVFDCCWVLELLVGY